MSGAIGSGLDGYTFKARYLPAFVVIMPAWLAFALWFPPEKILEGVLASAAVTVTLGALLAQVGRDAGKKRQQALFKEWGGSPSLRALAYRYGVINPVTLARCHAALNKLVPSLNLPATKAEEAADWKASKAKYESAGDYLRAATRDKEKFRLVYAENVNYGFRRNLWGMKPAGIAIAILAICSTALHACRHYLTNGGVEGLDVASLLVCVIMLTLWVTRFTKSWVRVMADEYASQLVAAADSPHLAQS